MKNLKKILCFAFPVALVMALVLGLTFMHIGSVGEVAFARSKVYVGSGSTYNLGSGTISGDIDVAGGTLNMTGGTVTGSINLNGTMKINSSAVINGTVNYQNNNSYITLTSSISRTLTVRPYSTADGTKIAYASNSTYLNTSRFSVVGLGSNQILIVSGNYIQISTRVYYNVTISAGTGGRVDVTSITNVLKGTTISTSFNTLTINGKTVTATAESGYIFSYWDISPDRNAVNGNTTIKAVFIAYTPPKPTPDPEPEPDPDDAYDLGVFQNVQNRGRIIIALDQGRELNRNEKTIVVSYLSVITSEDIEDVVSDGYAYYSSYVQMGAIVEVEFPFTSMSDIEERMASGEFDIYFPNAVAELDYPGATTGSTYGLPGCTNGDYSDFGGYAGMNPLKITGKFDGLEYYIFSMYGVETLDDLYNFDQIMVFFDSSRAGGSTYCDALNQWIVDIGLPELYLRNIADTGLVEPREAVLSEIQAGFAAYNEGFAFVIPQWMLDYEGVLDSITNYLGGENKSICVNMFSKIAEDMEIEYPYTNAYTFLYTDNGYSKKGKFYSQEIVYATMDFLEGIKSRIYLYFASNAEYYDPQYPEPSNDDK